MKSGIYKLIFENGRFYIGRSVDIENRWRQHAENLTKGIGAKLLQDEFDRYRAYDTEVIASCHPDHLDILEAYYIYTLKPNLNTTIPEYPFKGRSEEEVITILNWLHLSSSDHLVLLSQTLHNLYDMRERINELSAPKDPADVEFEAEMLVLKLREENRVILDEVRSLRRELQQVKKASLIKRILGW